MNLVKFSCVVLLSFGLVLSSQAETDKGQNRQQVEPQGWLYGAGVAFDQGIYKDFDTRIVPIPLIGYRSENLTVFGPFVNYHFYRKQGLQFSAKLVPVFEGYDESDSPVFAGMQERDFSLALGLGANYQIHDIKFEVGISHDILGRYDGYQADIAVSKVYRFGPFFIEPNLRLIYQDSHYVDYYYGVLAEEASATRAPYTANSTLNRAIGLSFMTPIFFGGMTRITVENTWYGDAIVNSPLTDADSSLKLMMSYSRFF